MGKLSRSDMKDVLPEFQEFSTSRKMAPATNIPWYALWVKKFLEFLNKNEPGDIKLLSQGFIASLRSEGVYSDWQLRQAEEAVVLYLEHFEGSSDTRTLYEIEAKAFTPESALGEMRRLIRLKHYSYSTERTYLDWAKRFFAYLAETKQSEPSQKDVKNFLSYLAIRQKVASSTQNQAFNALLFLFRDVLQKDFEDFGTAIRAKRGKKLPVVLSVDEVKLLFENLSGQGLLVAQLLYGSGLRLMECARLRAKDIDYNARKIIVRGAKGDNDRATVLPMFVQDSLRLHLEGVKELHEKDLAAGNGEVYLPGALDRKYPNAGKEWAWQYVFPAGKLSVDPRSNTIRRHHVSDKLIQSTIKKAFQKAGIVKHATVHTLRHSFATHMLMNGVNIREVQELLGHKNVETTMIYTHVMRDMKNAPVSPLDVMMKEER
jgi:integron integrase